MSQVTYPASGLESEVKAMDNDYISRQEYEEHSKRMEDEHRRINYRVGELEKATEQNNKLLVSVEKLALNMETMQKEQQKQGERLEAQGEEIEELKNRDGEKWRNVTSHLLTTALGIFAGYILKQVGIF